MYWGGVWGRGKLFSVTGGGGRGAQSNLFVHTWAAPDQSNWYIRTGFRGQIWQEEEEEPIVFHEYIYLTGGCTGHNMKLLKKRNCFILPVINIILTPSHFPFFGGRILLLLWIFLSYKKKKKRKSLYLWRFIQHSEINRLHKSNASLNLKRPSVL